MFKIGNKIKKPRGKIVYEIIGIGNYPFNTQFKLKNTENDKEYYYDTIQMSGFQVVGYNLIVYPKIKFNFKDK